ncbi:2-oxo-4-hydroxy-4-carboxy-5-ureidoimidazoline decarboxylase [Nocardia arthritidis]|nr:2-oxo-4-hydroxy-4-carboxy-5-ureidoimidazoline decarboxylase [Nocardia arthritidis]
MSNGIGWLNALPPDQAERELLTCCASPRWARTVASGLPYADAAVLIETATAAVRELAWPDVEAALAAHPRIGDRAETKGPHGLSEREAAWSRSEQSGAADADTAVLAALAQGNRDYEQRFGHVFLIRAAGRDAAEMLVELHKRLGNPPEVERDVVRDQLAEITGLRVAKLVEGHS